MSVGVMEDYKLRDLRVSHTLGYAGKHIVSLVLVVSQQETVGLVRRSRHQSTWVHVHVYYESKRIKARAKDKRCKEVSV